MAALLLRHKLGVLWGIARFCGRERLSWMLSLLIHACVILMLLSVWMIVLQPARQRPVGPVVGGYYNRGPALKPEAPKGPDEQLSLAGPAAWPAPAAVSRQDYLDVYGRAGAAEGHRQVAIDLPGGGPDTQLRLPVSGDAAGLTDIGRPWAAAQRGNVRVVYVLDASGSMIDCADAVKRRPMVDLSFLAFDQQKGRGDSFNIIFYRNKPDAFWPGLLPATDRHKLAALRWLRPIRSWGQTEPAAALRLAFSFRPDHIVILSDGEFDPQVLAVAEGLLRSAQNPVKIIAIGYGKGFSGKNLEKLASMAGGSFIRLSDD